MTKWSGPGQEIPDRDAQEAQELLMAMTLIALSHDPPLQDLQGRKQRGRAVAFVVVRHRATAAFFHGQARLRAIQRLNLALLVHANHHRLLGRIQVKAHHVGQLLQKPRVARQLEALHPVRFYMVAPPDVADRRFAHSLAFAMVRQLQWVIPAGLVCRVASTMALIFSAVSGFAPPSRRDLPKTFQAAARQSASATTSRSYDCPTTAGNGLSACPAAAAKTILPRSTTCWGVPCAPAIAEYAPAREGERRKISPCSSIN